MSVSAHSLIRLVISKSNDLPSEDGVILAKIVRVCQGTHYPGGPAAHIKETQ